MLERYKTILEILLNSFNFRLRQFFNILFHIKNDHKQPSCKKYKRSLRSHVHFLCYINNSYMIVKNYERVKFRFKFSSASFCNNINSQDSRYSGSLIQGPADTNLVPMNVNQGQLYDLFSPLKSYKSSITYKKRTHRPDCPFSWPFGLLKSQ